MDDMQRRFSGGAYRTFNPGARAAYVESINNKEESELLLPRNTKYRRVGQPKEETLYGWTVKVQDVEVS